MLKNLWRAAAIAAGLALAAAAPAHAQAAWPAKPIKFIVPTPPGGSPDIISRLLADELQKQLGQAVVVENRPGGGGGIGMTAIARSAPDCYTIGYGNVNTLAINRTLFKKLAYDVDRDIAPSRSSRPPPTCSWCAPRWRPGTCRSCWPGSASSRPAR